MDTMASFSKDFVEDGHYRKIAGINTAHGWILAYEKDGRTEVPGFYVRGFEELDDSYINVGIDYIGPVLHAAITEHLDSLGYSRNINFWSREGASRRLAWDLD